MKQVRALAFDYAVKLDLKIPKSWERSKMAGKDWMRGFLQRRTELSIRKPQATSLARAMAFNRFNVGAFFGKLKELQNKYHFAPQNIFNMDETGVTTVQIPDRVVARKGTKQVGRIVAAERGTLVTLAVAVSAIGNLIPPFFIFPRKKYKKEFIVKGPIGCGGSANPSGWMNGEQFYEFLEFFQSHVHASIDNPVLLILDNHESHLSIRGLDYCKDNGIFVLSLPPHCSHKLQPLDRSCFGPFKGLVNTICDNWVSNNPGDRMTIYHIPGIIDGTLAKAASNENIRAGFECTGICPLNENKFADHEFAPSIVTDRDIRDPDPAGNENGDDDGFLNESFSSVAAFEEIAGAARTSTPLPTDNEASNMSVSARSDVSEDVLNATLENIRPYPKAAPRKSTPRRGRKTRRSEILTSSPVLNELRKEQEATAKKKAEKEAKKTAKQLKGVKLKKTGKVAKTIVKPAKIAPRATRSSLPARLAKPKPSTSRKADSDSESDIEMKNACCVCGEKMVKTERFKLCIECRGKAHIDCVRTNDKVFTCPNCFTDMDVSSDDD